MKKNSRPKTFIYAGLDFILDRVGKFHFLEANDHPVGLQKANQLSLEQKYSIFKSNGIDCLTESLVNCCHNKYICLLLPDCFKIENQHHSAQNISLKQKCLYEGRIKLTVDDFNQLANNIQKKYSKIKIVDCKGIKWKENRGFLVSGEEIGSLYRRSSNVPMKNLNTFCVNDIRARSICTDKQFTSALIQENLPQANSIKNFKISEISDFILHASELVDKNHWIILKPKNGSASMGVERIRLTDISMSELETFDDYVIQPWIEPATIKKEGFEYYFDIRVFVIEGQVVSGFARQAAAPISGVTENSPLSWCTTTGPSLPIISSSHPNVVPCVSLTDEQIYNLYSLSNKIVCTIDRYTALRAYDEVIPRNIDFKILHNISGKIEHIALYKLF